MRAQLSWILRGRINTIRTLDALSADLRALQVKVDAIQARVDSAEGRLSDTERGQVMLRERQLDEFDRTREAVVAATDDLAARVAALHERLDAAR